jgi:acetyl-CoA synthetase
MMTDTTAYWAAARTALDGLPGGHGLNIAHEAVDRHVQHGRGDVVALRTLGRDGRRCETTYADLADATARFANALAKLGVRAGDTVFVLLGRTADLYVAVLGALKQQCVVSPLFSAFGPEPVRQRMELGSARVLVTSTALYERRVLPIRSSLTTLQHVILTDASTHDAPDGCLALSALVADADDRFTIPPTDPEAPALLHFTSGTTGTPKGVLHVHEAVVAHHATAREVLDLQPGDVFWCTADPGWVTGTSYGIVAPLTHGVTLVVDEADFEVTHWYDVLETERVSVWYTAPTAIRMLMRAGDDAAGGRDLTALRIVCSVGEPLNAEAVYWGRRALDRDILDNWWQTETGGIMVANRCGLPVRPGSMGKPVSGIDARVLAHDEEGRLVCDGNGEPVDAAPGVEGELALRRGWPSMFRAYLGMEERYRSCFVSDWYRSGDIVRRDDDGYFWIVGRSDDVIKSAGHLIGPFEVERVLMAHPAVAEAAVIGVPDPVIGEMVKAYVTLKAGVAEDATLHRDLMAHARRNLGAAVAPREILVREELPHTRSGKIMRRLLRARELGLPEGDLSTLEPGFAP